jgi:polyphosphate kinase
MTRNLTRRVEVVTPVEDESLQKELQVVYHFETCHLLEFIADLTVHV